MSTLRWRVFRDGRFAKRVTQDAAGTAEVREPRERRARVYHGRDARRRQDELDELALTIEPPATQGMPEPDPDSFAPGVLFEAGDSWIDNVVHLEIPIQKGNGRFVKLPWPNRRTP